ncbi:MAG TPA: rod shape-determining protein MreD [Feifaniaceae bacterium]|nr:rod shape-determining protein MreD [Feifaniaceae bacterium]
MNKKLTAFVTMLVCMHLDSVVFARLNLFDIRPDAMLAAAVSFGILQGPMFGAVYGAVGGLLMDLFFGTGLGLYGALYLSAGLAAGFFYKKFYADNLIVPAAAAAAAGFLKDFMLALLKAAGGARFPFAGILLRYVLPCAILTGVLCALTHIVLKPLLARQVKRRQFDRLSH